MLFRISQFWNSKVFAEDLQADTFPTALELESFRISQFWNSQVFAEDQPTPFRQQLVVDKPTPFRQQLVVDKPTTVSL